jgi:hypothetical protein
MKKRINYPESLHRYLIYYKDGGTRVVTACGATNAHYIASNLDPSKEINLCKVLDDSWKFND